jgi:hypothetical protein
MRHWVDARTGRQEVVRVPTIALAIALSLAVHLAVLLVDPPRARLFASWDRGPETAGERLAVRLVAGAGPAKSERSDPIPQKADLVRDAARSPRPPARAARAQVATASGMAAPRRSPPSAAVPSLTKPKTNAPSPPAPSAMPPAAPQAVPTIPLAVALAQTELPTGVDPSADLWSYVQARRSERGAESDALDNVAPLRRPSAADDPVVSAAGALNRDLKGGGIFEIKRMDYDDAEFVFYGWNDARRLRTPQYVEVRKGDNSDMRIAVVRRMIVIIREYSREDFVWRSKRSNRDYVLSARAADTPALEEFLMREFFDLPGESR